MVFQGSALRSVDIRNLYCLLQDSPLEECGKHNNLVLLKLPEEDRMSAMSWLLLSGLPNKKVGCFQWELKWGFMQPAWTYSVSVCDFEVPVNQILAWRAGLQPWVIHQSFSADYTEPILFPFGCFCVDPLPNSANEFFQCLHCPHVAFTFTLCTSKCLASSPTAQTMPTHSISFLAMCWITTLLKMR